MIRFILILFIIWRLSLFIIALFGGFLLPFSPSFPYSEALLSPSGLPGWFWSFANFDGVHYLTITQNGYSAQFTQVFFPFYPLLIRFFHLLAPYINEIIIGVLLSCIFFLSALFLFWKLLSLDYKIGEIKWILVFILLFPTSFYFGGLYTESIFIFLVFASFYQARKGRWMHAGIFGAFASATRLFGILLLPALLWEWHNRNLISKISNIPAQGWSASGGKNQKSKVKQYVKLILDLISDIIHSPILYLVPLGLLSYMVYLQIVFGDGLYFWHAQPVFGAQRSGGGLILLPQVIWRYIKMLTSVNISQYSFWVAFWELNSVIAGLILLVLAWINKVRRSYLIFSLSAIILPTLTGTFSSMPRYILIAFPMFIVLGLIDRKSVKILISIFSLLLLIIFTILFTRGFWVS